MTFEGQVFVFHSAFLSCPEKRNFFFKKYYTKTSYVKIFEGVIWEFLLWHLNCKEDL